MDRDELYDLTREMMDDHGLTYWHIKLGRARGQYGKCDYRAETITISAPLAAINPESETRSTILHEIAHALVGPGYGHGPVWKAKARELGCSDSRTHSASQPPAKWLLVCSNCDFTAERQRRTNRSFACTPCCKAHNGGKYHEDYMLQWAPNPAFDTAASAR